MASKDVNAFLTFVYAAETGKLVLDLILAHESGDQLSIAKSYKHIAKMIFVIQ